MTDEEAIKTIVDPKVLNKMAIALLARREHAVQELRVKLLRRGACGKTLDDVLVALQDDGYLSDVRYAEMLVRSRFNKSNGPIRARQELKQFQVPNDIIQQAIEAFDGDWFESAKLLRLRRFSDANPDDFKAKAKQMRFLASRGFTSEQIDYALSADLE